MTSNHVVLSCIHFTPIYNNCFPEYIFHITPVTIYIEFAEYTQIYLCSVLFTTRVGSNTITRPEPVPIVSILASTIFTALSRVFLNFSLAGSVVAHLHAFNKFPSALLTEAFQP